MILQVQQEFLSVELSGHEEKPNHFQDLLIKILFLQILHTVVELLFSLQGFTLLWNTISEWIILGMILSDLIYHREHELS